MDRRLEIRVALMPELAGDVSAAVCIVIDVLRATTVIATLFEAGCPEVFVGASHDSAREFARRKGYLLCGETGGYKVPDFDYGNSPVEFSKLDLTGRAVVLSTTNGTKATVTVAGARRVFLGTALNCRAVAATAFAVAEETDSDIVVVCSGTDDKFTLEDAMVAGLYVEALTAHGRAWAAPIQADSAIAVRRLWEAEPNLLRGWMEGRHARLLADRGFGDDVAYCSAVNTLQHVPTLVREAGGPAVAAPVRLVADVL